MDKKAHSRPMKAIVDRLETYGEFEITYFGDDTIMDKPIAEWPSCDCLLSWHSDGFPLAKVTFPLDALPRIYYSCCPGTVTASPLQSCRILGKLCPVCHSPLRCIYQHQHASALLQLPPVQAL